MYLRFQGKVPNLGTASKLGIFQLAFDLREQPDLPAYAYTELQQNLSWLKMHLQSPRVLDQDEHFRAICWFKPTAIEPIKRTRTLKAVLEEFGYFIDTVKTDNPGKIIYEDGWQVVAKPWRTATYRG